MRKQSILGAIILTFTAIVSSACGLPLEDGAGTASEVDQEESPVTTMSPYVVTDIQLRASYSSTPPPGPTGYSLVGYWDVDGGGSLGTNGSTGSYMMAMYAKYDSAASTATCVEGVLLVASNESWLPPTISPDFTGRGYWDVDGGGGVGGNGVWGHYMMGLYTRSGSVNNGRCIVHAELVASNSSQPPCLPGYNCAGWWDVDRGGGRGTYGSYGSWMMAFSTLSQ